VGIENAPVKKIEKQKWSNLGREKTLIGPEVEERNDSHLPVGIL
jgi:hypothetical protein